MRIKRFVPRIVVMPQHLREYLHELAEAENEQYAILLAHEMDGHIFPSKILRSANLVKKSCPISLTPNWKEILTELANYPQYDIAIDYHTHLNESIELSKYDVGYMRANRLLQMFRKTPQQELLYGVGNTHEMAFHQWYFGMPCELELVEQVRQIVRQEQHIPRLQQ